MRIPEQFESERLIIRAPNREPYNPQPRTQNPIRRGVA